MKRLLLILFLFSTFSAFSQSFYRYRFEEPWSISASLGPTQYFGELYSFWKYNEGIQPDWHANFSVNYIFGTHLKARLEVLTTKCQVQILPLIQEPIARPEI